VSARILAGAGVAIAMRKLAWTNDLRLPTYAGATDAARGIGDDGNGTRLPVRELSDAVFGTLGFDVPKDEVKKVSTTK
jgi:hypothetical protein